MADMDMSDTVKFYSIKKYYDGGGTDGHYEIMINPVTLTSADLDERYDLSAPIYKFEGYVYRHRHHHRHGEGQYWHFGSQRIGVDSLQHAVVW